MKQGKASPEKNGKPSITMNVRTRTPLEAHQMLIQGQPVDVMGAYYQDQGNLQPDFWMQDKTAKLHMLAELRADNDQREKDILFQLAEIEANQIQKQHDIEEANKQKAEADRQATPGYNQQKPQS